jgi:hypothetical protein
MSTPSIGAFHIEREDVVARSVRIGGVVAGAKVSAQRGRPNRTPALEFNCNPEPRTLGFLTRRSSHRSGALRLRLSVFSLFSSTRLRSYHQLVA